MAALVALLALVAVPYYYYHADEELRVRVEAKIAQAYPKLNVRVRHAHFAGNEAVEIRGISISERAGGAKLSEIAYIDELILNCRPNLQDMMRGQLNVTKIRVSRPVIRAARRRDGSWSAMQLLPLPKLSDTAPSGVIENATLEISDPVDNPSGSLTVRDLHVSFSPTQSDRLSGPRAVDINGHFSADYLPKADFRGSLDPDDKSFELSGKLEKLGLSPELLASLPAAWSKPLARLSAVRGEVDLKFSILDHPLKKTPLQFAIGGRMIRGRVDDARLPYPLNDLRAEFRCNRHGYAIESLTARNGSTTLRLRCRHQGYDERAPMEVEVEGDEVPLNEELARSLPESLRRSWYDFRPEGTISASVKLAFDGERWKPDAVIQCHNVALTYHKFPYRMEQGQGRWTWRDDVLSTDDFHAFAAGERIDIRGRILRPGPHFTGELHVDARNVPFDKKLFAALPAKAGEVVQAMHPAGTFNAVCTFYRKQPNDVAVHREIVIDLNHCVLQYDKFPYPFNNVCGRVVLLDDYWRFESLSGTNDTALVAGEGELRPTQEGSQLTLQLRGKHVPLEEELRDAMPQSMQQLWQSLRPRGEVDLETKIGYSSATRKTSVELSAWPRDETSIEPAAFPYRMERLRGRIDYRDGVATIREMRATHGRTTLSARGSAHFTPEGSWKLELADLFVDRLQPSDRELFAALPDAMKHAVTQLKPSGPVNLHGDVLFARGDRPQSPLRTKWNLDLLATQLNVDAGVRLEQASGKIHLQGEATGGKFASSGELDLDTVNYQNHQFTQVRGPIWFDNQQVVLGAGLDAAKPNGAPASQTNATSAPRPISARWLNGAIVCDGRVALGTPATFQLHATVADANVAQYARENLTGQRKLNGRMSGSVVLQGNGQGLQNLKGAGKLNLRDADIYELPVMVSLLKILTIKPPDATAFTSSDMEFRVEGPYLLFDRITFNGDAISLEGKGQMSFEQQVDLTFHTMVGRNQIRLPVVHNLLGEASQQIMEIRVTGAADNPQVQNSVLPGVNQTIQQLQSDLQMPLDSPAETRTSGLFRKSSIRK